MFTQLKDLLSKSINKQGLQKNFKALEVINAYKKYCNEILGEEALENLIPRYYKNKMLYIDASNSSWAQHLHLKQTELLNKINDETGNSPLAKFYINIQNKT